MTGIEWADKTWNVVNGCSPVSPGCLNCYAARLIGTRLAHLPIYDLMVRPPKRNVRYQWTRQVHPSWDHLEDPLKWKDRSIVFVASLGDLFHAQVPFRFIDQVIGIAVRCALETGSKFVILTKRPERMARWYLRKRTTDRVLTEFWPPTPDRTLPGIWPGTSVELDRYALPRIAPLLLFCPAEEHVVSLEPLLGPVDLGPYLYPPEAEGASWLSWVIIGGETGPHSRKSDLQWIVDASAQCWSRNTPVYVKQLGSEVWHRGRRIRLKHPRGADRSEWPDSAIPWWPHRQYPRTWLEF